MATAPSTMLTATSVMPSLTVDDVARSLAFFEGLGFEVEERWEENDALLGVMLKAGDVRIGLSKDDGRKGRDRVKGAGFRLYLEVAGSIDDLAARVTTAGIPLTKPPYDGEGSRMFDVTEPSGFVLTMMSPSSKP
jgi:predicted enzyme related to lactoylglutathione lyase